MPPSPESTGVSRFAARSETARKPEPQPARSHFWPPHATMSAASQGRSTAPTACTASTISSRSPMTWRMPSRSATAPVRASTALTSTAIVVLVSASRTPPGVTRPLSTSSQIGVTTCRASEARATAIGSAGYSAGDTSTPPASP